MKNLSVVKQDVKIYLPTVRILKSCLSTGLMKKLGVD